MPKRGALHGAHDRAPAGALPKPYKEAGAHAPGLARLSRCGFSTYRTGYPAKAVHCHGTEPMARTHNAPLQD